MKDVDDVASPAPLVEFRPTCPVLIVADTRRPVNQGFGARTTFLMWAADVALHLGAVLSVDDRFWSRGLMRGYHYGNSFLWAWRLFPFANVSSVVGALPQPMAFARHVLTVDELLRTWECGGIYRLQAGQMYSCGETVRWCYDRLPGALSRGFEVVTRSATPYVPGGTH